MVLHQGEKTGGQSQKKPSNGPSGPAETHAPTEAGKMPPMGQGAAGAPVVGGKKELSKDELRLLFQEYERADAELKDLTTRILDAKRKRSRAVEKISEGSPKTKTFRLASQGGKVFTIMSREDKNEKSPSLGERFFYFRTPGIPDPLDL